MDLHTVKCERSISIAHYSNNVIFKLFKFKVGQAVDGSLLSTEMEHLLDRLCPM